MLFHHHRGIVLVEVMVMLVIISLALTVGFTTLSQGRNLSQVSENRVKAINAAREGIEIVSNIRDANYKKMSSSYQTCWMVADYDTACANGGTYASLSGTYTVKNNPSLGPWQLSGTTTPLSSTSLTGYELFLTPTGIQQGLTTTTRCVAGSLPWAATSCVLAMWREIAVTPLGNSGALVSTKVIYRDPPSDRAVTITLSKTLTNWGVNLK